MRSNQADQSKSLQSASLQGAVLILREEHVRFNIDRYILQYSANAIIEKQVESCICFFLFINNTGQIMSIFTCLVYNGDGCQPE